MRDDALRAFAEAVRAGHPKQACAFAKVSVLPADFRQAIHPSFLINLQLPCARSGDPGPSAESLASLTPSQRTVARRASDGASNSEIATDL